MKFEKVERMLRQDFEVAKENHDFSEMTDDYEYFNVICYECGGYGDDYYYDEELDELVCRCDTCWVNEFNQWGERE